jgi:hypothetical protein
VVLDKHGYITEQGSFSALDSAGGYISSFALETSDTSVKLHEKLKTDPAIVSVYPLEKNLETELGSHGGERDITVYLYYVRSIGWLSTSFFGVAITGFVFTISFPSKWMRGFSHSYINSCL